MKGLHYLISLQDKVSAVADRIGGKVRNLVSKLDGLTAVQDRVESAAGRASRGLDGMSGSFNNFMKVGTLAASMSIGSTLMSFGQQAINVGKDFVDAALNVDGAMRVIKFASGKDAAENFSFLYRTIDKLNLPLAETRSAFTSVAGAFKDTALQGQPMRDIFEGVSMATSAMNLSSDTTEGVFLALSQIMSKGKVSAEELTGQLGERLPGALSIAARSMGVSTGKLMEMMQNGELLAVDFLPKFANELKKTFGDEAVKAVQSPQSQLTRLSNKFQMLKEGIGQQLLPTVIQIGVVFMEMIEKVLPYIDIIATFIRDRFAKLSPALGALVSNLSQAIEPFKAYMQTLFSWWDLLSSITIDVITMLVGAVDWGNMLSRIFSLGSSVLQSLTTILGVIWKILGPVVGLVIKLAGWILEKLGGLGLRVLEEVAWAFSKIAKGVEWVYDKIVALLEAVGLLDKKSVSIDVKEKLEKVGSGGIGTTLGSLSNSTGGLGGTGMSAPPEAKKDAKKINEGGSRPININIKYDAMNKGGITIHTTSLKEGTRDIERFLEEMLLRTLNGATQLATR